MRNVRRLLRRGLIVGVGACLALGAAGVALATGLTGDGSEQSPPSTAGLVATTPQRPPFRDEDVEAWARARGIDTAIAADVRARAEEERTSLDEASARDELQLAAARIDVPLRERIGIARFAGTWLGDELSGGDWTLNVGVVTETGRQIPRSLRDDIEKLAEQHGLDPSRLAIVPCDHSERDLQRLRVWLQRQMRATGDGSDWADIEHDLAANAVVAVVPASGLGDPRADLVARWADRYADGRLVIVRRPGWTMPAPRRLPAAP